VHKINLHIVCLLIITLFNFTCQREKPPKAPTFDGPSNGSTNIPVSFTVVTTDPNKDDVAYLFNWGDGTRDSWSILYASGQTVSKSHNFTVPGNYDVVAKAKDEKGNESEWSTIHRIVISSQPPNIPAKPNGPQSARVNAIVSFSSSTTDPDGDSVAYQFDWSDGSELTWTGYYKSGTAATQTHIFTSPGSFNVKVKAKDKNGVESNWSEPFSITITTNQVPNPPSRPTGPSFGWVNIPNTFSSSATDPDGDSIAIRFDWGNGVISSWSNYKGSGATVSMSYSYPDTGIFYVRAQTKDIWGDTSSWSSPLTIIISSYSGWVTIMEEDFEGVFPGSTWALYGSPTWNDVSYRYYQGSWSGWCAGSTMSPPGPYAPNMDAWMVFGPFSLADASAAVLSFYRWLYSESNYDYLFWGASIDGTNFYGYSSSGDYRSWSYKELDLTNVPTLGNLCGYSQVWIAFNFSSDNSYQYEGAYLDNILLEKYVSTGNSQRNSISTRRARTSSGETIIPWKGTIPQNAPRIHDNDLKNKKGASKTGR